MTAPTLGQCLAYAKQVSQYENDPMFGHSRNEAMICVLAAEVGRLHKMLTETPRAGAIIHELPPIPNPTRSFGPSSDEPVGPPNRVIREGEQPKAASRSVVDA